MIKIDLRKKKFYSILHPQLKVHHSVKYRQELKLEVRAETNQEEHK